MSDLTEFLLAMFAKDEAVARAAGEPTWSTLPHPMDEGAIEDSLGEMVVYAEGSPNGAQAAHIARWDPARVLAECEAKRAIVEAWALADRDAGAYPGTDAGIEMGLHQAMTILALPYADHPAYDPEWRP